MSGGTREGGGAPVGSPRDHPVPLLRWRDKELAAFVRGRFPRGREAAARAACPSRPLLEQNAPLGELVFLWIKRFTESRPAVLLAVLRAVGAARENAVGFGRAVSKVHLTALWEPVRGLACGGLVLRSPPPPSPSPNMRTHLVMPAVV